MKVTIAQTSPKLNRCNLDDIVVIIQKYQNNSDLIVFPELSLSGYLLQDKLQEDAWELKELELLAQLSVEIDIVVGGAIKESDGFKNSALYFSKGKLLAKHDKLHLPNYGMFEEARYFESGDSFESFSVGDEVISMVVCEDLWHKNVHEKLLLHNPTLIIALIASPARGFENEELSIESKWYEIIKSVAKKTDARVIFVNRVGFEDGLGFWGGSCVVERDGNFVKQLPKFKEAFATLKI